MLHVCELILYIPTKPIITNWCYDITKTSFYFLNDSSADVTVRCTGKGSKIRYSKTGRLEYRARARDREILKKISTIP